MRAVRFTSSYRDTVDVLCHIYPCRSLLDHHTLDNGVRYLKMRSTKVRIVSIKYTMTISPIVVETTIATFMLIMKKGNTRLATNNNTERRIPTWGSQMYLCAHCRLNVVISTDAIQSTKLISSITIKQTIGVGSGVAEAFSGTNVPLAA